MGRRTVLSARGFTLGTGNILAAFQTAAVNSAGALIRITRIEVGQSGTTTLGMCDLEFATRDTAGTLTMTSTTPQPLIVGGAASGLSGNTPPAGAVARSGTNSSADSGGTYTNSIFFAPFANTAGFLWKPDPKEELFVPPSKLVVVRFATAPAATTGWMVALHLDEDP